MKKNLVYKSDICLIRTVNNNIEHEENEESYLEENSNPKYKFTEKHMLKIVKNYKNLSL